MGRIVRANDGITLAMLHPRYWPMWLGLGLMCLLGWLPWVMQKAIGAGIGALAYRLVPSRVNDTRVNLALCFPALTDAERETLVRDVFRQGGIGVMEVARGWMRAPQRLLKDCQVVGLEHVQAAHARGRGVIILGAHYSHLDLSGVIISQQFPLQVVYRPQNNPVADWFIRNRRAQLYTGQIDHADMRTLFKALKNGETVWTSVDQDFGLKQGVMAPFFGVPAATLTATSRMAKVNGSAVLFSHFERHSDDRYSLSFTPALDGYPSGDDVLDATRINAALADLISRAPAQYMWFHRRFKSQADGVRHPYATNKKPKKRPRA